jgi:hypothetical protein
MCCDAGVVPTHPEALSACRPEGQKGHGNAKEATEATEKRARSCKLLEFGGKRKGIGDSKKCVVR